MTLLETRRYKVVSLDNYSNAFPEALVRVSELARDSLPANASEQDIESTKIEAVSCDLTREDQVRAVFECDVDEFHGAHRVGLAPVDPKIAGTVKQRSDDRGIHDAAGDQEARL